MLRYPVAWMRVTWLTLLLIPLSWLFRAAVGIRRSCYRTGLFHSERLPVPVMVVGNISVGGTGKTPLVLGLVAQLRDAGYQPGIISRGYGGSARLARCVGAGDDPAVCGDEPLLLARHSACPVWIGKDRVAAARAMLAANPACDVIVSDDGLQHYRMARDVEVAVVDGARGLGNGRMLPAGPLREPASRLSEVDAVVVRAAGVQAAPPPSLRGAHYAMTLKPAGLRSLRHPSRFLDARDLQGLRVHAAAGIGNPQQFFDTLSGLGISHTAHAFPDHHVFVASDLAFSDCDAIVMTEKDAVKCEHFATDVHWALQVEAVVDDALTECLLQRLQRKN